GILSISWNREFGVIEEPKRAMMRALKPVFDDTGTKLAFLVINIDIAELLKSILDGLAIDFPIYMTSGTNSLLLLDPNTGTIDISIGSFGDNPEWISNAVRAATAVQKISEYDNKLVVSQQIRETRLQDGELHLGLLGNFDDAFIYMRKSSLYAVFGLILILGSTAVAIHRTDHQLRPLLQMKEEVSLAWHDGHFPDLPVDRNDEVGDLARSFNRLVETLTDRETTAKAVFNGVSHGIVITNGEGHITDANTALLEMFDCTISDLMGQQIDILLPASLFQSHIDFIQRKIPARKFEKIGSTEAVVPNFSGVDFDIEVTTNGMTDWPNPSTVSIIRDVSERKFIEREVLQLVENLERSNKDLEDFAYVASHDLKAPLRAIKQIAEWLEEDLSDKLDPDSQENLATLQQRANRMSSLLDSLLEHARIGRGRKKTHSDIITGDAMAETLFSLLSLPEGFSVEFDD
ncbi:MAG: sensor histidine kinase, partial [Mangrovicoccus sp.]